ncbi:MAG: BatA domain-containing protein [Planctomycetaceae bacterium]
MGILVPLYLAGLTALSLPLILHLVRRTPRGRQEFSSLMFLSPTPPRLTRRSRLDQILLLLLRLAALALIVLAFARPFLREAASLTFADLTGKRLAILIDTSASMRRADLWQQAVKLAETELDQLNPQDDVALFAFNDRLQTIIDFQKEGGAPIADKPQVVRNRLKQLQPAWGATDLGTALVSVASDLDSASDVQQSSLEPQIVVISDFQSGSRIEALQSFEWPKRVPVVARRVSVTNPTNAHAHALPSEDGDTSTDVRVRVVNAADSRSDQFFVVWVSGEALAAGSAKTPPPAASAVPLRTTGGLTPPARQGQVGEVAVYVPAGQSRVIRLPRGVEHLQADRIVLRGDDHDFDNTFFVVPPRKLEATLLYAGKDAAEDPEGLQLYLRLAVANDPLRQVEIRSLDDAKELALPPELAPKMVVVSQPLSGELPATLKQYVERGGVVLLVPRDDDSATLLSFIEDVEVVTRATVETVEGRESRGEKYLLLGDIDFTHPLFAPFASPRYNDFTKIHFWKHRPVTLKTAATTRILARFDNGDPMLLERSVGQGRVIALTSGWHPEDSQLALSSKFVPLIGALLDLACGGAEVADSVVVHQPVTLMDSRQAGGNRVVSGTALAAGNSQDDVELESPVASAIPLKAKTGGLTPPARQEHVIVIRTPDGQEKRLDAGHTAFSETDLPGIYRAKVGSTETRFAVNLSPTESHTAPLNLEQLEQRGVRFGADLTRVERIDRERQQRDTELESRQKVWRWLIVIALATLILETWWAGRAEQQIHSEISKPVA